MKVELREFEGTFTVYLKPESAEEAGTIVRMGMNATKQINYVVANVDKGGNVNGSICIIKHKRAVSQVGRGRY